METINYYEQGRKQGRASGSWVTDGNTKPETYRWILEGFDEGNPEVLDLQPNPLSGELAGESIPEIFGHYPEDDELDNYEEGFTIGFWEEVLETCRTHTENL